MEMVLHHQRTHHPLPHLMTDLPDHTRLGVTAIILLLVRRGREVRRVLKQVRIVVSKRVNVSNLIIIIIYLESQEVCPVF